jgi:hypothetical protein
MSYRAFWQRRCRAAAAGAVLKPQGGNCAVLPLHYIVYSSVSKAHLKTKKMTTISQAQDGFQGQYRIILSADTASEVRQLLSQKRR